MSIRSSVASEMEWVTKTTVSLCRCHSSSSSPSSRTSPVSTSAYSSAGFRLSAWLAGMVQAVVVQIQQPVAAAPAQLFLAQPEHRTRRRVG